MRTALVSAIAACVGERRQKRAQRFLQGLSFDELQYIAEYLGACLLESSVRLKCDRHQLLEGITRFDRVRSVSGGTLLDQEHKMLVLLEYLCRCKLTGCSLQVTAERARN